MVGQSDWLPITMATLPPIAPAPSAVLEIIAFARLQYTRSVGLEIIDDRLPGGNLEPGDIIIGNCRQMLDPRAQAVAVGRDAHRFAPRQLRQARLDRKSTRLNSRH